MRRLSRSHASSKVFTRGSILLRIYPEYLISPPSPSVIAKSAHEGYRRLRHWPPPRPGTRAAISCATCAIPGKTTFENGRSRTPERCLLRFASFRPTLPLSDLCLRSGKRNTCLPCVENRDINSSAVSQKSKIPDTPIFTFRFRSPKFVTKHVDV